MAKRKIMILIVMVALTSCVSCATPPQQPPSPPPAPVPTKAAPVASAPPVSPPAPVLSIPEKLYQEANELAKTYFKKNFTKCEDIYIWAAVKIGDANNGGSFAGKGEPTITVKGQYHPPKELTAAQKLNHVDPQQIEWEGTVTIRFAAGRMIDCKGCMSGSNKAWQDDYGPELPLSKVKGKWDIGDNRPYWGTRFLKLKCSDIPQDRKP